MEEIPILDGRHSGNVVPLPGSQAEPEVAPTPPRPGPEQAIGPLIEGSAKVLAGFVSVAAAALSEILREVVTRAGTTEGDDLSDDEPAQATPPPNPFGLTAGAAAGLLLEMSQAAVRAATSFAESVGPILSWFADAPIARQGLKSVRERAQDLDDRWNRQRPALEDAATAFLARIIPELTNAILDRVDLTQVAIERVGFDRIVEEVDLDRIVERIDIDRIVGTIDLDALIDRVDLVAIADRLIEEIDLPELIRESTGAVTSETVRSVRMQSAQADLLLARIVDRLLRRNGDGAPDMPGVSEP